MKLDLEIIIVSHNTSFWVKKCLSSLQEFPPLSDEHSYQITVVDNASSDDTIAMLAAEFPKINVIALDKNVGFSAGNNAALCKTTARYTMLLNSDTELHTPQALEPLLTYSEDHSDMAVITPRLNLPNGELDWACHRGEPTLWNSFWYFTGVSKWLPGWPRVSGYQRTWQDLSKIHAVEACSGAAMIVRTSAMRKVGLLDESFFMYAEDLDWCKRFRDEEFQIIYHPGVTITHHKYKSGLSATSTQLQRKTSRYFYDTMLQYYDKHYRSRYPEFVRSGIKYILSTKGGVS
jgi:GT2 family glycosyltransferase